MGWLGEPVRVRLLMDSSAGRWVFSGIGFDRILHLEVRVLWTQDVVRKGRVLIEKVDGANNVADLGTKPLGETTLVRHRDFFRLVVPAAPKQRSRSGCALVCSMF